MGAQLTLGLKNDLAELARVSRAIDEFGQRHALPAAALFDLHLAVDEILTNVISYAYDDGREHEIIVLATLSVVGPLRHIELEVRDDGRPFNPLAAAQPDVSAPVDERPVGGLGIHLVRRVMDDLEYRRQQGKNVLVMRKTVAG